MQLVNPITADTVIPHIGKPVCIVLNDETCYYGYLSGMHNGQILLNEGEKGAYTLSTSAKKAKAQLSAMTKKAKTSAIGYGGYGGVGRYGPYGGFGYGAGYRFDAAAIALLFILPFLFV